MTKKEAKEISLEVWWYLKEYPEINQKSSLPESIYKKVKTMHGKCPLCQYMFEKNLVCSDFCPLQNCKQGSLFVNWFDAKTNTERKGYATQIYKAIKSWKV